LIVCGGIYRHHGHQAGDLPSNFQRSNYFVRTLARLSLFKIERLTRSRFGVSELTASSCCILIRQKTAWEHFMFTRREFIGLVVATFGILTLGSTGASAQSIRFFVVHSSNGGLYEIRDGSGTGGRFVQQSRSIAGASIRGYTDRAQRGETILTLIDGYGGIAEYVALRSDNGVVNLRASYVYLPDWKFDRVWLNPNVDNVYASAKLPGRLEVRQRIPIGTRPPGALN
jgi:hypothetical protein